MLLATCEKEEWQINVHAGTYLYKKKVLSKNHANCSASAIAILFISTPTKCKKQVAGHNFLKHQRKYNNHHWHFGSGEIAEHYFQSFCDLL